MKTLRNLFRRLFCHHEWAVSDSGRYAITSGSGRKMGEVTLTILTCSKCGKDTIIPSDRTNEPTQEEPKTQP